MKKLGKKFEKFPVRYAVTIFDGNAAVQNFKRDFNWRVGKSILKEDLQGEWFRVRTEEY